MHPVNRILSVVGLRMFRPPHLDREAQLTYRSQWARLKAESKGYQLYQEPYFDAGNHPLAYFDLECEFAARHLCRVSPRTVLDIGSYRLFIIGLLTRFDVTTLDIRERVPGLPNEKVLTSDAKKLDLPSESFDAVVSLCSLEHFGLARYGDEFDLDGDRKAFNEMIRVLAPGGTLIFSTTFTRAARSIAFNAHRIYDRASIEAFCSPLEMVEEKYIDCSKAEFCGIDQTTAQEKTWDVYCGCWRKPGG
jgi:SAM-dependent methyltransferase